MCGSPRAPPLGIWRRLPSTGIPSSLHAKLDGSLRGVKGPSRPFLKRPAATRRLHCRNCTVASSICHGNAPTCICRGLRRIVFVYNRTVSELCQSYFELRGLRTYSRRNTNRRRQNRRRRGGRGGLGGRRRRIRRHRAGAPPSRGRNPPRNARTTSDRGASRDSPPGRGPSGRLQPRAPSHAGRPPRRIQSARGLLGRQIDPVRFVQVRKRGVHHAPGLHVPMQCKSHRTEFRPLHRWGPAMPLKIMAQVAGLQEALVTLHLRAKQMEVQCGTREQQLLHPRQRDSSRGPSRTAQSPGVRHPGQDQPGRGPHHVTRCPGRGRGQSLAVLVGVEDSSPIPLISRRGAHPRGTAPAETEEREARGEPARHPIAHPRPAQSAVPHGWRACLFPPKRSEKIKNAQKIKNTKIKRFKKIKNQIYINFIKFKNTFSRTRITSVAVFAIASITPEDVRNQWIQIEE